MNWKRKNQGTEDVNVLSLNSLDERGLVSRDPYDTEYTTRRHENEHRSEERLLGKQSKQFSKYR